MTSIIICTTPQKLLRKQGKDQHHAKTGEHRWTFWAKPKKLGVNDQIYFSTKKVIRGYFQIEDITPSGDILFRCDSWKDTPEIPIKKFRGFLYADTVKELQELENKKK